MREYFRYFRYVFLALGILFALWLAVYAGKGTAGGRNAKRSNTECMTEERVFDYADVLTDEEENRLREQIAKREKQAGADIVLVTLNESLEEYARAYDADASYSEFTRIYADNFYDEHKFGYNKPVGDGILLLDNGYREEDGRVYTWLCTTGKVEDRYSVGMIDRILDEFYEYVDTDPYRAYSEFVDNFYEDMRGGKLGVTIPGYVPFLVALFAAGIFVAVNLTSGKGKKTTNVASYVNGGRPEIKRKEDTFIRKSVVSRTIESGSGGGGRSSGGGGHHVSSGGHSHGGGGHSR